MIQDIDQPIFEPKIRRSNNSKWLIGAGVIAFLLAASTLFSWWRFNQSETQESPKEVATPMPKLSLTPTIPTSPSGSLRMRWRQIKNELNRLDPQQSYLQPPDLDFDIKL